MGCKNHRMLPIGTASTAHPVELQRSMRGTDAVIIFIDFDNGWEEQVFRTVGHVGLRLLRLTGTRLRVGVSIGAGHEKGMRAHTFKNGNAFQVRLVVFHRVWNINTEMALWIWIDDQRPPTRVCDCV